MIVQYSNAEFQAMKKLQLLKQFHSAHFSIFPTYSRQEGDRFFDTFFSSKVSHKKEENPCIPIGTVRDVRMDLPFRNNIIVNSRVEYGTGNTAFVTKFFNGNHKHLISCLDEWGLRYEEKTTDSYYQYIGGKRQQSLLFIPTVDDSHRRIQYIELLDSHEEVVKKITPARVCAISILLRESQTFVEHISERMDILTRILDLMKDRNRPSFVVSKSLVSFTYDNPDLNGWASDLKREISFNSLGLKDMSATNQIIGLGIALLKMILQDKEHSFMDLLQNGFISIWPSDNYESFVVNWYFPPIQSKKANPPKKGLSDW